MQQVLTNRTNKLSKERVKIDTLVKLARSRSLVMLGKSTGNKNGIISTKQIWEGIHRVSDIRPSANDLEHQLRVYNREDTQWESKLSQFKPRHGVVKDQFVVKY